MFVTWAKYLIVVGFMIILTVNGAIDQGNKGNNRRQNGNSIYSSQQEEVGCNRNCFCAMEYRPFCGSNGVTYSSKCRLECAKNCDRSLRVHFEGVCPKKYVESRKYSKYPGIVSPSTNRPTVSSRRPSFFRRPLPSDPKCTNCACPYILNPVCGSDGVSYDNPCVFECARKTCNPKLRMKSRKSCGRIIEEDNAPLFY